MSRTSGYRAETVKIIDKYNIINMELNYKQAILIGITQGLACFPGISRSGSTIAVSRMAGVKDSARYSFLISIPIIIASFVMELFEVEWGATVINWGGLLLAMFVCMVVGLLCIKVMTKLVSKNKLTVFAYYLIVLSIFLLIRGL